VCLLFGTDWVCKYNSDKCSCRVKLRCAIIHPYLIAADCSNQNLTMFCSVNGSFRRYHSGENWCCGLQSSDTVQSGRWYTRLEGAEGLLVLEMASADQSTWYRHPLTSRALRKQYLKLEGLFVSEFVKTVQSVMFPRPYRLNERVLEC
jgi:hypothetical protein